MLVAPGLAQAQTDPDVGVGQVLVELNCSRCHATGLTGASPHSMAPPFRTLGERYPMDALEEAFASGHITSAHPDMPDFTATPDQIGAIIAYIASIQAQ
ncbi:c-type cytochrome [Hoeflea marina]|nr:cytochrome c [Hoeflea marina]